MLTLHRALRKHLCGVELGVQSADHVINLRNRNDGSKLDRPKRCDNRLSLDGLNKVAEQ